MLECGFVLVGVVLVCFFALVCGRLEVFLFVLLNKLKFEFFLFVCYKS